MTSLSVKQKALVFLNRYRTYDRSDIYNTPWDLTQDGIAGGIGVSRAHASIVLNQLKNEDKVEEKITHIRNGKIKRKSYFITPLGMDEAERILETAAKENIDVSYLLDPKKQRCDIDPEKLGEKDRYTLGCACAFHMAVDPALLPPVANITLPLDVNGKVSLDDEFRNRMFASADEEERALWHGYAADYWFDKKLMRAKDLYECLHELLYQYVESGRNRDACKLISGELYHFVYSIDDELRDTVAKVRPIGKYERDVLVLSAEICLEYGDTDGAEVVLKRLSEIDSDCASVYYFDIAMMKGDRDAAKAAIVGTWQSYPMAGIRWASLLREDGRCQEAADLLDSMKDTVYEKELGNFQVEKFSELARIDCAEGRYDDAYMRISKLKSSFNNDVYNRKIDALEKELRQRLNI